MWRNPADRPAISSYDTFLKDPINSKQKTFIKKVRWKQASYFQRFFSTCLLLWISSAACFSLAFIREHLCISMQCNNLTNLNQWYDNHPLIVFCCIEMLTPVPMFLCLSQCGGGLTEGVLQWDRGAKQMPWDALQNKRERGNAPVVWLEQPQGNTARRLN